MGLRAAAVRVAINITKFARSNHEPVNVAAEGVELVCPVCKVEWPCAVSTEHTDRIARLEKELAK